MKKPFDADSAEPMRRFARPIRDFSGQPESLLCRHLSASSWYAPDTPSTKDGSRPPSSGPYGCLRTMRPAGPDGMLALPDDCTDERICFEASLEREFEG